MISSATNAIKLLSAGVAAMVLSVSAQADVFPFESNGRTAEVRYQDLNLGNKADRHELDVRIRRAAVKVCRDRTVQRSRACQLAAIDHVRAPLEAAIAKANGAAKEQLASVSEE